MAIKITEAELWSFNVLNNAITNAQAEMQKLLQARQSYIELLEQKYGALFNPKTGAFELKPEPVEKKEDKKK